jgi:hypothetical protein
LFPQIGMIDWVDRTKMTVFLLQHIHNEDSDHEDIKIIGIYSTIDAANAAIARSRNLPGFNESSDGFYVDEYEIDVDHWTSGYKTIG